jgi:hypothetical protein
MTDKADVAAGPADTRPRTPAALALSRLLRCAPALRVTTPLRRGNCLTMAFADRSGLIGRTRAAKPMADRTSI